MSFFFGLAILGYVFPQDVLFRSVTVGFEPYLDNLDALLTGYSLGLDELALPYLPGCEGGDSLVQLSEVHADP